MSRIVVATHQPDLLPYSGFWYKLAKADLFDVKLFDQFVERGYQRRVQMREQWFSLPRVSCPRGTPITEVMLLIDEAKLELKRTVEVRYSKAPHYQAVTSWLFPAIDAIESPRLWEFNMALLFAVRDHLGITTPFCFSGAHEGRGSVGLVEVLQRYPQPLTYLSGTGAKVYMGDCTEFTAADIDVVWSAHRAVTGDSILTVLMDYDDPMAVILAEAQ